MSCCGSRVDEAPVANAAVLCELHEVLLTDGTLL